MHTTFVTWASEPSGSEPRPSFCCKPCFSCWDSTSKPTATWLTPSRADTCSTTAVWKWERIGQPGVVRETTTSTRPSAGCSIERTIPRSTMLWRSSGSMTTLSAWLISSCVGMCLNDCGRHKNKPARPRRAPPAEGGEILHCQPGYEGRQLYPGSALSCGRGEGGPPRLLDGAAAVVRVKRGSEPGC